jgi:hypothetical protein
MIFVEIHVDNDSSILISFLFDHLDVIRLLSCDVRTLDVHCPLTLKLLEQIFDGASLLLQWDFAIIRGSLLSTFLSR